MLTLRTSPDNAVAYLEPVKHNGAIHTQLAAVGAFYESRLSDTLCIPLSTQSASALRSALTGVAVTLAPEAGKSLAAWADAYPSKSAANVIMDTDGEEILINTNPLKLMDVSSVMAFVKARKCAEPAEGVYRASLNIVTEAMSQFGFLRPAPAVSDSVPTFDKPDVDPFAEMVTDQTQTAMEKMVITLPDLPSFSGFDGTLASLKWVPLDAYEHIRNDSEKTSTRNRKIASSNKTAKKKKSLERSLAQRLASIGVTNAFDVLHRFPNRHIDRSSPQLVRQLVEGEEGAVLSVVGDVTTNYDKRYVRIAFEDMVGDKFSVTFFQQMYLSKMYSKGDQAIVSGKFAPYRGFPSFASPKIDRLGSDRSLPMVPVYPSSEKNSIATWDMLALVKETLGRIQSAPIDDPLSAEFREQYRIPERSKAYMDIHLPPSPEEFKDATRRLVYDELLRLQVFIQKQRNDIVKSRGIAQDALTTPTVDSWRSGLPYALTGAQERAVAAIKENMAGETPMYRLIQGDVGSGKSALATWAVLNTVDNGHQSALLAPTEILAEQLFKGLASDVDGIISPRSGMPMNVRFLGGKTPAAQARKIRAELADGSIDAVVGTHALLTEDTTFADLATVVIDEQHRFGVEQRSKLRQPRADGRTPDMMLMTATPIPRSSAMVLYGDMDLTVLDELPPGRTPIKTVWEDIKATDAVEDFSLRPWDDIRDQVRKGHQAYVVASLVEDNEKLAAQSVEDALDKLSNRVFPDLRLAMVHGKQKSKERDEIMSQFAAGEIDVLVATTVIEVGVNVPNTTVMVVLDPGRFGISQLHQIRGRVGRSNNPSTCWLVGEAKTFESEFRLNAMVESTDGFWLSEKDLELRGEGTLFSTRQSGQGDLFLAKISEHMPVLETAKNDARELLEKDPELTSHMGRILNSELEDVFGDKEIKS